MSERIYVDTNVWLDYFLNRTDRLRPLGSFAFELFAKSVGCAYIIVISDWLRIELKAQGCQEQFESTLSWLADAKKVVFVKADSKLWSCARKKEHWQDELHMLLAQKADASFLVTRNTKDFSGPVTVVYPEQL